MLRKYHGRARLEMVSGLKKQSSSRFEFLAFAYPGTLKGLNVFRAEELFSHLYMYKYFSKSKLCHSKADLTHTQDTHTRYRGLC